MDILSSDILNFSMFFILIVVGPQSVIYNSLTTTFQNIENGYQIQHHRKIVQIFLIVSSRKLTVPLQPTSSREFDSFQCHSKVMVIRCLEVTPGIVQACRPTG